MSDIKSNIETLRITLLNHGRILENPKWQGISTGHNMYEVESLFFKARMPATIQELENQTLADLPWAENHFRERISGNPANPGYEYKNWPYYRKDQDDNRFRSTSNSERADLFSHTYMERFWPSRSNLGYGQVKFRVGDYNDIVDQLIKDRNTRQAYLSIWHPEDQSNDEDRRKPCSLGYYFSIRENKLNLTYHIRSVDFFRHLRNDIYMAVRLAQDVCNSVTEWIDNEVEPGILSMWIGNLHCFDNEKFRLKKPIFNKD